MLSFSTQSDGSHPAGAGLDRLHLKKYRKRATLTLQEVGDRLAIHFTAVQKWEAGISSPTVRDLLRLADLYDVHPSALFLDPEGIDTTKRIDALTTLAGLKGVNPAALVIAGTEPERQYRAELLTRCNTVLDRRSPEWGEHWIKLGEMQPFSENG